MKAATIIFILSTYCFSVQSQTIPSADIQIKTAVLAAPEDKREGVQVFGYSSEGKLIVLREGTNEMICLADDPNSPGFNVACYHKDVEPFMARGRALKVEGKSFKEIFDIREEEAKNGNLKMPKDGTTLFVLTATDGDYNTQTGEVSNAYIRYVVYIPWATAESTGLPLSPDAPGMPWIMDPGTHRAHIMINPPKK